MRPWQWFLCATGLAGTAALSALLTYYNVSRRPCDGGLVCFLDHLGWIAVGVEAVAALAFVVIGIRASRRGSEAKRGP